VNNERLKKYPRLWVFFILVLFLNGSLCAAELSIAVASNFKHTLQKLGADFKLKTGHVLIISSASSGKLYAQIKHGAPFDVFLSADEKRADLLVSEKIASADSAYVYALGKLVLVSNVEPSNLDGRQSCKQVLGSNNLLRLAIANPKIAPYGHAANQVLDKLGLWKQLQSRIIMGENISQTFQFVATKNADAGFVAQSMIDLAMTRMSMNRKGGVKKYACLWHVPTDLYSPIKQKMVVLNKAKNKQAVEEFVRYMKSSDARDIIVTTGYDTLDN
jgi:molybdate transport system substrate-binding protein